MNRFKIAPAAMLALAIAFLPSRSLLAQEPSGDTDSVLTVSIAPIDRVLTNVSYLMSTSGAPEMGTFVAVIAQTYTEGLDRTRPIGLTAPVIDSVPSPVLMIPTTDLDAFLKRLEPQVGQAEELDDGTLVISVGANLLYIKEISGNWAIAAQQRGYLENAPSDPMAILGELSKDYDVAIQLKMSAVPESLRNMLLNQMEQGFRQGLERQEGSEEDRETAEKMGRQMLEQFKQVIGQTDTLQIGWATKPSENLTLLDVETTARAGTELARQINEQRPIPSRFASVVQPDAAAYLHAASSFGEQTKKQARMQMDQIPAMVDQGLDRAVEKGNIDQQARAEIREIVDEVVGIAKQQVELGKSDMGFVLRTDNNQFRLVGGAAIADGGEVAALLKRLATLLADQPDAPEFNFDAETYNGVTFHRIVADLPADEEEARKIFGEQVNATIGTADQAVYLALGPGSEPLLKELIDASQTPTAAGGDQLMQAQVALRPIFEFAAWVKPNSGLDKAIEALRTSPGKDQVTITSNTIENGQQLRLTIGEALLKAGGAAAKSATQRQPQF